MPDGPPLDADQTPSQSRLHLLSMMAAQLLVEDACQELVDEAREHFDIGDPADQDDADLNRQTVARDELREYLRKRLTVMADEYADDHYLGILQLAFNPRAFFLAEATTDTKPEHDDPDEADAETTAFELLRRDLLLRAATDQPVSAPLADAFVHLFADRVTDGDHCLPRPLPAFFGHVILELPGDEDTMILLMVTRAAHITQVTKELHAKYDQLFVPGKRDRQPHDPGRDAWVLWQYHNIRDNADLDAVTAYDELLIRFEASVYADDLEKHDLDTRDGQRIAKVWLRQIVHRQRCYFQRLLAQADFNIACRP